MVDVHVHSGGASGAVDSAQQRSIGDLQSTLKQKDSTLAEQALEISMLKQQLAALQSNSNNNGASGAGVGSTKGPGMFVVRLRLLIFTGMVLTPLANKRCAVC